MLDYLVAFNEGLIKVLPLTTQGTEAFLFMLLGMAIGFAVGILPGLGGATTLALMLPFIYNMEPVTAFAFLLGSVAVTSTTGDITSVLFGVPGEGISAATILDGHPMAKNGEAGRALGAALMSSLVGAIFGAFALALALLGITFLAALSGGNLVKGFVAGGFGLTLSMVGMDPVRGAPRFVLEPVLGQDLSLFLWDGVALVAVAIGVFAIPEIIDMGVKG